MPDQQTSEAPARNRRVEVITTTADVVGATGITVGALMVSTPLGLVVGGALTMLLSWLAAD